MFHDFKSGFRAVHAEVVGELVNAELAAVVDVVDDLLGGADDEAAGANGRSLVFAQVGEVEGTLEGDGDAVRVTARCLGLPTEVGEVLGDEVRGLAGSMPAVSEQGGTAQGAAGVAADPYRYAGLLDGLGVELYAIYLVENGPGSWGRGRSTGS